MCTRSLQLGVNPVYHSCKVDHPVLELLYPDSLVIEPHVNLSLLLDMQSQKAVKTRSHHRGITSHIPVRMHPSWYLLFKYITVWARMKYVAVHWGPHLWLMDSRIFEMAISHRLLEKVSHVWGDDPFLCWLEWHPWSTILLLYFANILRPFRWGCRNHLLHLGSGCWVRPQVFPWL